MELEKVFKRVSILGIELGMEWNGVAFDWNTMFLGTNYIILKKLIITVYFVL
jgi:hypothetical protein